MQIVPGTLCIGWRIVKVTLHGGSESNSPRHPSAPTSEYPSHEQTIAPCSTRGGQLFTPEVVTITIYLWVLCRYNIIKNVGILTPPSATVRHRNHVEIVDVMPSASTAAKESAPHEGVSYKGPPQVPV